MSDHTHGEYEISETQKRYFTPTTEEVRADYITLYNSGACCDEHAAEVYDAAYDFDRWLAEVKADAWQDGAYHIAGSDNELVTKADNENPYREGESSE